jgi:hypothetical protein
MNIKDRLAHLIYSFFAIDKKETVPPKRTYLTQKMRTTKALSPPPDHKALPPGQDGTSSK